MGYLRVSQSLKLCPLKIKTTTATKFRCVREELGSARSSPARGNIPSGNGAKQSQKGRATKPRHDESLFQAQSLRTGKKSASCGLAQRSRLLSPERKYPR